MKRFKQYPHPDPLPRVERVGKGKNLTAPLTLVLSQGERRIKRVSTLSRWRGNKEDGRVLMDKIKGELGNGRVMARL
jgi:hypothetical protein